MDATLYTIVHGDDFTHVSWKEAPTTGDLTTMLRRASAEHRRGMPLILEDEGTDFDITPETMRHIRCLAMRNAHQCGQCIAFVVQTDKHYRMGKVLGDMCMAIGVRFRTFRDAGEARRWANRQSLRLKALEPKA